jgi:hypothetical protein
MITDLICRCGMVISRDTLSMINHITSPEHERGIASKPPTHNHSDKAWDGTTRRREDCPACISERGKE